MPPSSWPRRSGVRPPPTGPGAGFVQNRSPAGLRENPIYCGYGRTGYKKREFQTLEFPQNCQRLFLFLPRPIEICRVPGRFIRLALRAVALVLRNQASSSIPFVVIIRARLSCAVSQATGAPGENGGEAHRSQDRLPEANVERAVVPNEETEAPRPVVPFHRCRNARDGS